MANVPARTLSEHAWGSSKAIRNLKAGDRIVDDDGIEIEGALTFDGGYVDLGFDRDRIEIVTAPGWRRQTITLTPEALQRIAAWAAQHVRVGKMRG